MADLEQSFLRQIAAEPENVLHRLVYADWLEEQGDPRAELLRLQEQLRRIEVPDRAGVEARMQELLRDGVQPLTITRTHAKNLELVLIFPGELIMGSPPEEEGHYHDEAQTRVEIRQPFWLGTTLITQTQYLARMEESPWQGEGFGHSSSHIPATHVSWERARDYCRRLTLLERAADRLPESWRFELPTEAQWEYACRAGTTTRFHYGHDPDFRRQSEYVWIDTEAPGYRQPVCRKKPNPWNLHDLHGNVWEWCLDGWYDQLPGGVDPLREMETNSRVIRGGSMRQSRHLTRSALRSMNQRNQGYDYVGFRVALVRVA